MLSTFSPNITAVIHGLIPCSVDFINDTRIWKVNLDEYSVKNVYRLLLYQRQLYHTSLGFEYGRCMFKQVYNSLYGILFLTA